MVKADYKGFFDHKMETLPPEEIKQLQFKKVKNLLDWVYTQSEFYRNRLKQVGVNPDDIKTWDDFRNRIPFMSKKDLLKDQEDKPPYGNRLCIPKEELRLLNITSGTSGLGQEVYGLNQEDLLYMARMAATTLTAAGVEKGDLVAHLWPLATMAGGWSLLEGIRLIGANPLLLFIFDTKSKIEHLVKYNPNFICTTTGYLNRLTALCIDIGIEPKKTFI